MPSYKTINDNLRTLNRMGSDDLAYCRGLSLHNAEYVLDKLRELAKDEPDNYPTWRFIDQFAAALADRTEAMADPVRAQAIREGINPTRRRPYDRGGPMSSAKPQVWDARRNRWNDA